MKDYLRIDPNINIVFKNGKFELCLNSKSIPLNPKQLFRIQKLLGPCFSEEILHAKVKNNLLADYIKKFLIKRVDPYELLDIKIFSRVLESGSSKILKNLLPWPYCIDHEYIASDSEFIPDAEMDTVLKYYTIQIGKNYKIQYKDTEIIFENDRFEDQLLITSYSGTLFCDSLEVSPHYLVLKQFHYLRYQRILKILENVSFESVLDLGCGDGAFLKLINEKYQLKKYLGIDKDIRERKNLNILRKKADIVFDKYETNYQLVTLVEVIEHLELESMDILLHRLSRSKSIKWVVVSTPQRGNGKITHFDHKFEWTKDEMIKQLGALFEIVNIEYLKNPANKKNTQIALLKVVN